MGSHNHPLRGSEEYINANLPGVEVALSGIEENYYDLIWIYKIEIRIKGKKHKEYGGLKEVEYHYYVHQTRLWQ